MIDPAQMILLLVVVILTMLLLVLGIQVFFILQDFRRTVKKANKVLDDTSAIAHSVSEPLSSLSTISSGIKTGAFLAKLFRKKKHIVDRLFEEDADE